MDHYFFGPNLQAGPDSLSRVKLFSQVQPKTSINLQVCSGMGATKLKFLGPQIVDYRSKRLDLTQGVWSSLQTLC